MLLMTVQDMEHSSGLMQCCKPCSILLHEY
jgi:hypothetical protein